jgi:hypothetical protein
MKRALKELLDALDAVADVHEEIHDTDVRERMSEAIGLGFVDPASGSGWDRDLGMFSSEGNLAVAEALRRFISAASAKAESQGLGTPAERMAALQDHEVLSERGSRYDDYLGHVHAVLQVSRQDRTEPSAAPSAGPRSPGPIRRWLMALLAPPGEAAPATGLGRPVAWSSMAGLLDDLDQLAARHPGFPSDADREAAQRMVIERDPRYQLEHDFGLSPAREDVRVRKVLLFNLEQINKVFDTFGLDTAAKRSSSFDNPKVHSARGSYISDYFGQRVRR